MKFNILNARQRYFELKELRPDWFTNLEGGYEILFQQSEMDAAEQAAWQRLEAKAAGNSHLSHASIEWVRVGVIVETEYLLLIRDAIRFPGGTLGTYERIMNRPESRTGAAVLAKTDDDHILLLQNHRHALRSSLLEAPRGFASPAEAGHVTAVRELVEEIQAAVKGSSHLGIVAPDSGLLSHQVELIEVEIETFGEVDRQEGIEKVVALSVEELHRKIAQDEIVDGFTLALYAKAIAQGIIKPPC